MTPEQRQEVKRLFAAASQLPDSERAAYLQQHAHVDAQILDEVRSLLNHHHEATLLPDAHLPATTTWKSALETGRPFSAHLRRPWFDSRGYLALGIALTALLIAALGYVTNRWQQEAGEELRRSRLTTGLNVTMRTLELWLAQEKQQALALANHPEIRSLVHDLIQCQRGVPETERRTPLLAAPQQHELRQAIRAVLGEQAKYAVWDRAYVTLADWSEAGQGVGNTVSASGAQTLTPVFAGQTVVQMPGVRPAISADYPLPPDRPRVSVLAPVKDEQGNVIAALLLYGLGAAEDFERILEIMRVGKTGETFAFDAHGLMISESRFNADLQRYGLLEPNGPGRSALKVHLRDPGGDLATGFRPTTSAATWPLTKLALAATRGESGLDLDGYRNYRGAQVVGAWRWWPEYAFGVGMEMETAELHQALGWARLESYALLSLFAASLLGLLVSTLQLRRWRRQAEADQQLGQYTLEAQIGEGGMATVYRARHALLKRPTAIKILKPDIANARTMRWFEREVQLVSQLRHPHTIVVYDYGVTEAGGLYYVMEYLDGRNLEEVVRQEGPLSVARTVSLLRQALGSLEEAHGLGLVHRDIKPHNLMLCTLGGEQDFLKVLDFGLVREVNDSINQASTVLAGTPRYMAPERFQDPGQSDPRSDLYALGAVVYYLLSGQEIFPSANTGELIHRIFNDEPQPLTEVARQSIPADVARLVHQMLARSPDARPADARAILDALATIGH